MFGRERVSDGDLSGRFDGDFLQRRCRKIV